MSPMIMFPASVAGLGVMAPAIGGGITAPGPWSPGAPAAWAGDKGTVLPRGGSDAAEPDAPFCAPSGPGHLASREMPPPPPLAEGGVPVREPGPFPPAPPPRGGIGGSDVKGPSAASLIDPLRPDGPDAR